MLIGLGVLAALFLIFLMLGNASYSVDPKESLNRINTACEGEYTDQGNEEVTNCELRHYIKLEDKAAADRDHRVDQAAGQ